MVGSGQQSGQELGAEVSCDKMLVQDGLPDIPIDNLELLDTETIQRAKVIQESRVKQTGSQDRDDRQ